MSKSSKLMLGVLSFLPFILVCIIIAMVINLFPQVFEWANDEPDPHTVFTTFSPIFFTGLITALVSLALLVIFIVHLVKNPKLEPGERLVWILIFLFVGMIGYPLYWYLRVWNEDLKL
jgi:hypothetical protein